MRTFLGLLMALLVSGDNDVSVKAFEGNSVCLPCACVDVNLDEEIKWQKISPSMLVIKSNKTRQESFGNYAGRANMNWTNECSHCSVLLTNISVHDHGEYKCVYQNEVYSYIHVNLHVCGTSKISQQNFTKDDGEMVFQCDLKDCGEDLEIQWTLNGKKIENSSMIISSNGSIVSTGFYHFSTSLSTKLNLTSKPECIRKVPADSPAPRIEAVQTDYYRVYFRVIPVVLVLGLSMILCFLRKSHSTTAEDIEENKRLEDVYTN